MNDSRFALYPHIIRREVHAEIGGAFDNPFAAMIDQRYREGLRDKRMFVNDLYLTIIRRGFQGKIGLAETVARNFRRATGVPVEDIEREALQELGETIANLANDLSSYGARVLKVVARNGSIYSEPCEFLGSLINAGQESPMLLPRMGLDGYLPRMRVTFGRKAMEWRGATDEETRFGAVVSIREYPAYSGPGMLDGLLRIPGEFIVSQSFAIQDRAPVLAQVAKVERQIAASNERGTEVERAIAVARDEPVTGRTVLGKHHLTILAMGRSIRDMERCVQDVTKELQNFGITTVREDMNAEPCFWAQLPGNFS
jgi:type IV secretion system protein VirB4